MRPRVQVGIDAHLFSRHGVEGKPRGHFGNPAGAFRDNHKINDDEDKEDNSADDVVPAD